ncbi:tail assembly protein, partial [Klebsiella pneumoniae]
MQEIMTRIELSGILGKTFGKIHHRLISTVQEAGIALATTIPGFEHFMNNSKEKGLTFAVFKGKKNIGKDDLGFPVGGEVIRIVPVLIGSKKAGLLQTILGAVIIVASAVGSYFVPGNPVSAFGYKMGAAMML